MHSVFFGSFHGQSNELKTYAWRVLSFSQINTSAPYRLFKYFSIGSAFDRLSIDGEINPKKGGEFSFVNDWNTVFIYGALYF